MVRQFLHPLRRPTVRNILPSLLVLGAFGACSGGGSSKSEKLSPPTLRFESAENTLGELFPADADLLELACDPRLTFVLGPRGDARGLLQDWLMRPLGNCQNVAQCGFLELDLQGAEGQSVARVRAASTAIVVDLGREDASEIRAVEARLKDGKLGKDYLVTHEDGQQLPVVARWELAIQPAPQECHSNGGSGSGGSSTGGSGAGGTLGTGGNEATGGLSQDGGAGGLGGAQP